MKIIHFVEQTEFVNFFEQNISSYFCVFQYDFAVEKNFLSTIPNYECKTKKEVSKNVDSSQKARQRHLKNPTDISKKSTVLPDTPDMARKQIKVAKSQTKENDDYQDLKDALAYAAGK